MTAIEWTDRTWNPIVGCSVVSPACTNCYAMAQAARIERMNPGLPQYEGVTQTVKGKPVWTGRVNLAPEKKLLEPLRWRKPQRVFVNSMSDLFHESVPDEWIDQVFAIMKLAPHLTFQVLTKRPKRMREYFDAFRGKEMQIDRIKRQMWEVSERRTDHFNGGWPLRNVWLGVTAEDQARADERIPELLATPAAVRFVSVEPMLGAVDLSPWLGQISDHRGGKIALDNQEREDGRKDRDDVTCARDLNSSDRLPPAALNPLMIPSDTGNAELAGDPVENFGIGTVDREASPISPLVPPSPVKVSLPVEHSGDVGKNGDVVRDRDGLGQMISPSGSELSAKSGQFSGNSRTAWSNCSPDLPDTLAGVVCSNDGRSPLIGSAKHAGYPFTSKNTLSWVICGGESGPGARPMHPGWARSLRDQCKAAGVPFFFKQWGEWAPGECANFEQTRTEEAADYFDGSWSFRKITPSESVEMHCDDGPDVWRIGKRRAGRLLDGVEHNAFPQEIEE